MIIPLFDRNSASSLPLPIPSTFVLNLYHSPPIYPAFSFFFSSPGHIKPAFIPPCFLPGRRIHQDFLPFSIPLSVTVSQGCDRLGRRLLPHSPSEELFPECSGGVAQIRAGHECCVGFFWGDWFKVVVGWMQWFGAFFGEGGSGRGKDLCGRTLERDGQQWSRQPKSSSCYWVDKG